MAPLAASDPCAVGGSAAPAAARAATLQHRAKNKRRSSTSGAVPVYAAARQGGTPQRPDGPSSSSGEVSGVWAGGTPFCWNLLISQHSSPSQPRLQAGGHRLLAAPRRAALRQAQSLHAWGPAAVWRAPAGHPLPLRLLLAAQAHSPAQQRSRSRSSGRSGRPTLTRRRLCGRSCAGCSCAASRRPRLQQSTPRRSLLRGLLPPSARRTSTAWLHWRTRRWTGGCPWRSCSQTTMTRPCW